GHASKDGFHGSRSTDDVAELEAILKLFAQINVFGEKLLFFQGLGDNNSEFIKIDRLGNIVKRSFLHSQHSCFRRSVSRNDDHFRLGGNPTGALQYLNAAFVRQKEIRQYQMKTFLFHDREGFFTPGSRDNGIPKSLKELLQCYATGIIIIN